MFFQWWSSQRTARSVVLDENWQWSEYRHKCHNSSGSVCDGGVINAGAVGTKDISEPGIYLGNPARLQRRF
jgi:hypothetical protein